MEEKTKKTGPSSEGRQLTYDELKRAADQLAHERDFYQKKAQELLAEVQQANMYNDFKRIDYLFKAVEHAEYFDTDFITKSVKFLQEFLDIPEPETPKEN